MDYKDISERIILLRQEIRDLQRMDAPHSTHPQRNAARVECPPISPDDEARWLALADLALSRGASEVEVAEIEALARKEQTAIKRRIQRRSQQVNRQSKSKQ
jgi:hypothetical protein